MLEQPYHTDEVMAAAVTADGALAVTGSDDHTIKVWDLREGRLVRTLLSHREDVEGVSISPDQSLAASASTDNTVAIWDLASGERVILFEGHDDDVTSVAFFPDSARVVSAGRDKVIAWHARTGAVIWTVDNIPGGVMDVHVTPDGRHVFTADWVAPVRLLDSATGKLIWLGRHGSAVYTADVSDDNSVAVSGSFDGLGKVWDITTGLLIRQLDHRQWGPIRGIAASPDGDRVYTGAFYGGAIREWDVATGTVLRTFEGHNWAVSGMDVSADGRTLVTGAYDSTVRIWDLKTGVSRFLMGRDWDTALAGQGPSEADLDNPGHLREANVAIYIPGTTWIASCGDDRTVKVWDVEQRVLVRTLLGHTDAVLQLAASGDGKTLYSAGEDGTIRVWDLHDGRQLQVIEAHDDDIEVLRISPDGTLMVSGAEDDRIRMWDLRTMEALWEAPVTQGAFAAAWSPDGGRLLVGHGPGADNVSLRDAADGSVIWQDTGHEGGTLAVEISPDGKIAATAGWDAFGGARLYDLQTGEVLGLLEGHKPRVGIKALAFSHDGRLLAIGSFDSFITIWDVSGRQMIGKLGGHTAAVSGLAFSPDDRVLASAGFDSTIRLWDVEESRPVHRFGLDVAYRLPAN